MILRRNEATMELEVGNIVCLRSFRKKRQWTVTICSRENWKRFKNRPCFCQTCDFRDWSESPGQAAKTLKDKILKKFSKCFSRLEGLLARESRVEPRKSLSNSRDWTCHSRTSRQNWPANLRLRPATWLTRNWVAKTGQKRFLKFFSFKEQNTFQKHLKHSKKILCLNQQRLSMWKHILSNTITQMNMAFIKHKLVCCAWISTMR